MMPDLTGKINEIMAADTGADVRDTIAEVLEELNERLEIAEEGSGGSAATLWNDMYPDNSIPDYTGDWTDDIGDDDDG